MVPTWTGKPGNGKTFPSQGKVAEFWTDWESQGILPQMLTGKVREFYPKCWKSLGILPSFYFFSSDFVIEVHLLSSRFLYLLNSWKTVE